MNLNHQPAQPMAIPLKIDHFRLRRQSQLEQELASRPLFKKVDGMAGKEWRVGQLKQIVSGNRFVPEGTFPFWPRRCCG